MMMYEHLRDAEMKKKFKLNIRKGAKRSSGGLLAPPKRLPQPESNKRIQLMPQKLSRTLHSEIVTPSFANFDSNNNDQSEVLNQDYKPIGVDPAALEETSKSEVSENEIDKLRDIHDAGTPLVPISKHKNAESPEKSVIQAISSGEKTPEDVGMEDEPATKPLFKVSLSDLISTQVRKSAAAAIIRGPPAARHFGGNRGGLRSARKGFGLKHDGIGPIVICGSEKSIVFFSDRDPPGNTYPIGASGAVLSDVADENQSEYMCCFLAKEKRMVVFELTRKTVVVELQMKTKLNFWRYLPPEAHGSKLAFMLITPIGGFHWKPLDESPRPCQVWKRGPELESKKILSYEEGGSNGRLGVDARSTVALVLASSITSASTVEAYCIALDGGSSLVTISNNILGSALYHPLAQSVSPSHFIPFVVTIYRDKQSQVVLCVEDLREGSDENESLVCGELLSSAVLDVEDDSLVESFGCPPMSMGTSPEVLCCCKDGFIVAIMRRTGLVFAYDFSSGNLLLAGKSRLGQYIVDGAIRAGDVEGEVELALLLCENDSKDGRIATIIISRA